MGSSNQLVVFTLDDRRYGLPLSSVDRVIRAVEIIPLPKAPEIIAGVINVRGRVVPVVNIRKRFRLPAREIALSDQFVIAHTTRRPVGLVADAVADVIEHPGQDVVGAGNILPGLEYVEGVVKLRDGLVLIHDLDKFLSLEEDASLSAAMEPA